jgi:hypothetical protein
MSQPVGGGAIFVRLPPCLLARFPQIDDFTHRGAIGTNVLWGNCGGCSVIEPKIPPRHPIQMIKLKMTVSSSFVQYTVS